MYNFLVFSSISNFFLKFLFLMIKFLMIMKFIMSFIY